MNGLENILSSLETYLQYLKMPDEVIKILLEIDNEYEYLTTELWKKFFKNNVECFENDEEFLNELCVFLDSDDEFVVLYAHIKLSILVFDLYQSLGIESYYIPTMSYYVRCVIETKQETGKYGYLIKKWGIRQASFRIFRIGSFEYEILNAEKKISIHIPADANMENCLREQSYCEAQKFFFDNFPQAREYQYVCNSWLLDPRLLNVLSKNSKIVQFQSDFIINSFNNSISYRKWVFNSTSANIASYPEKTTLQIKLKKYLMDGNSIGVGYGILKFEY